MSVGNQTATQKADNIIAQLIYGIVVQMVVFYSCNIWLTYLPTPSIYFLHHTYLFSLYLAYKLNNIQKEDKHENLNSIFEHLQDVYNRYTSLVPLGQEVQCLRYLLILAAIWHIPTLAGLLLTYIILSQSYGHQQTESLLHIPLIFLCSLLAIATSQASTLPFALILSPTIFILMFSDTSLLKPKDMLDKMPAAKGAFIEKVCNGSNITDKIILSMIAISLVMPFVQLIPYLCVIHTGFNSPFVTLSRFFLATMLLGERGQQFLTPNVQRENIECLFTYAKENAFPTILRYSTVFTQTAPDANNPAQTAT